MKFSSVEKYKLFRWEQFIETVKCVLMCTMHTKLNRKRDRTSILSLMQQPNANFKLEMKSDIESKEIKQRAMNFNKSHYAESYVKKRPTIVQSYHKILMCASAHYCRKDYYLKITITTENITEISF